MSGVERVADSGTQAGPPDNQDNRSRMTEAVVTGGIALFAGIIGGLISFGTTYFTVENQAERNDFQIRRTAYVEFFESMSSYRISLIRVNRAVMAEDQSEYNSAIDETKKNESEFYSAAANVALVSDLGSDAWDVYVAYTSSENPSIKVGDFDRESLSEAINAGDSHIDNIFNKAQQDMRGDSEITSNPENSIPAPR